MTEPGERGGLGEPGAAGPGAWARSPRRGRAAWAVLTLAVLGVALLGALGWAGPARLGLAPAWTGGGAEPRREPATPLEAAQAAGFAVQACPDEAGAGTCLIYRPDWEDSRSFVEEMAEDIAALARQADALDLVGLDLRHADGLASLDPLRGMGLTYFRLGVAHEIKSLEPLRGMPLRRLDVRGANGLTSLEPLRGMPLLHLGLAGATGVTTLAPFRDRHPSIISGASEALLATLEE